MQVSKRPRRIDGRGRRIPAPSSAGRRGTRYPYAHTLGSAASRVSLQPGLRRQQDARSRNRVGPVPARASGRAHPGLRNSRLAKSLRRSVMIPTPSRSRRSRSRPAGAPSFYDLRPRPRRRFSAASVGFHTRAGVGAGGEFALAARFSNSRPVRAGQDVFARSGKGWADAQQRLPLLVPQARVIRVAPVRLSPRPCSTPGTPLGRAERRLAAPPSDQTPRPRRRGRRECVSHGP
ncbi:hypothetical protein MET9862_05697 [Methylobacterium symbioticum]|uniref:Uncharacterized protein n=1 Tax=Methylobacterium symbioticum TaxID=2584084 RepID=A0A509EL30_9HYPH|nr:hypothetical protein MET9862_05697 [Methylobacterium symbioticum]